MQPVLGEGSWGGEVTQLWEGRAGTACLPPGESSGLEAQWRWSCHVLRSTEVTSCSNPV